VPHFPEEDSKLRATGAQVRRGGNCGNTLEVLQELLRGEKSRSQSASRQQAQPGSVPGAGRAKPLHLMSPLPDDSSPATAQILSSFGGGGDDSLVDSELCLHRAGLTIPASSYIIRSESTGSRTIVSHVPLPEMTKDEFAEAAASLVRRSSRDDESWWHFEVRQQHKRPKPPHRISPRSLSE
jgi:ketohexokinase